MGPSKTMGSDQAIATIADLRRIPGVHLARDLSLRSARLVLPVGIVQPADRGATAIRVPLAMATDRILHVLRAQVVTGLTLPALLVMVMRVHAAMAIAHTLHVPLATGMRVHVVMVTVLGVRPEPAEIDPIQLDRHATVILAHHEVMATALTLHVLRATGMRVHVAMANDPTLHAQPVMATARTRPARVAMATVLVARRAQAVTGPIPLVRPEMATDPIPRAHRATARARIAPMAIARAPIDRGMTGLAQTGRGAIDLTATGLAQTGRGAIAPMATDPAATGSPRAVNDVRSVRR
jgi:hypothetical protein